MHSRAAESEPANIPVGAGEAGREVRSPSSSWESLHSGDCWGRVGFTRYPCQLAVLHQMAPHSGACGMQDRPSRLRK